MAQFKGVVKLTEAQFRTLSTNGTITVDGITYTYDPNGTLYVTDDTSGGSGGVSDVQVDSNSVVSSGIAQFSTINGNYNASTNPLATQSDLSGGGGGSQLYMHYIEIETTDVNAPLGTMSFSIINSSNTQISFTTLFNWLTTNGFTDSTPYRNVWGVAYDMQSSSPYNGGYIGVDIYGATEIMLSYIQEGSGGTGTVGITLTPSSSNYTLTDKVITL